MPDLKQWAAEVGNQLKARGYTAKTATISTLTPGLPGQQPPQVWVAFARGSESPRIANLVVFSESIPSPNEFVDGALESVSFLSASDFTGWKDYIKRQFSGAGQVATLEIAIGEYTPNGPVTVSAFTVPDTPMPIVRVPGKVDTTVPPTQPSDPPPKGDPSVPIREQVIALATSSMGTNTLNWDQWNFFYLAVTGNNAPAPEARGFAREPNGLVKVNGVTQFDFDTWAQAAGVVTAPAQPQPAPAPAPGRQLSPAVTIAAIAVGVLVLRKLLQ